MKGDREKEREGREGRKREVGRKEIGKAGREREREVGGGGGFQSVVMRTNKTTKKSSCAVQYLSGGLRRV